MLSLYHSPMSRSSRFVWLLEELGADYELRYVEVSRPDGSGGVDPANPHPDGKVPALVHDGVLVTESAAICLYLTDLFAEKGLGPAVGDPKRGPYLTWLAYYAGVIEPVVVIDATGHGDDPGLRRSFRGMAEMHARVGGALEASPYLLGEEFSAADLIVASLAQVVRPALPAGQPVDGWLERINARPALARAMAKDAP